MFDRACFASVLRTIFALLVLVPLASVLVSGPAAGLAVSHEAASANSRLHVVLLNGGGQPSSNYYSHLRHIQQFLALLRRTGLSSRDITVFNADGAEPQADFAVRDPQTEP